MYNIFYFIIICTKGVFSQALQWVQYSIEILLLVLLRRHINYVVSGFADSHILPAYKDFLLDLEL